MVKHLSTMWGTWVRSLGWEDSLEKEVATHSSTLALKIPWMEELGAGYYPWDHKESGTTERLHVLSFFLYEAVSLPHLPNRTVSFLFTHKVMIKPVLNPVLFFFLDSPGHHWCYWALWEADDTETQLDVQKFVFFSFRENIYEGNCGRSWRRLEELTERRANSCEGKEKKEKSDARVGRKCGSFKKAWQSCWLNPQSIVSQQRTINLLVSGIS